MKRYPRIWISKNYSTSRNVLLACIFLIVFALALYSYVTTKSEIQVLKSEMQETKENLHQMKVLMNPYMVSSLISKIGSFDEIYELRNEIFSIFSSKESEDIIYVIETLKNGWIELEDGEICLPDYGIIGLGTDNRISNYNRALVLGIISQIISLYNSNNYDIAPQVIVDQYVSNEVGIVFLFHSDNVSN